MGQATSEGSGHERGRVRGSRLSRHGQQVSHRVDSQASKRREFTLGSPDVGEFGQVLVQLFEHGRRELHALCTSALERADVHLAQLFCEALGPCPVRQSLHHEVVVQADCASQAIPPDPMSTGRRVGRDDLEFARSALSSPLTKALEGPLLVVLDMCFVPMDHPHSGEVLKTEAQLEVDAPREALLLGNATDLEDGATGDAGIAQARAAGRSP